MDLHGITAAIYGKRSGLKVNIIEKGIIGGNIANTHLIENYPALMGISGFEFSMKLEKHLKDLEIDFNTENVLNISKNESLSSEIGLNVFEIETNKNRYFAKNIIISTGTVPKSLNIPGEQEYYGKGVSHCATCDGMLYKKKDVAVVSQDVKGELTYEDKVIQKIIGLSLEKVPGLLDVDGGFFSNLTEKIINTDNVTRGVNVEVGKEQVAVDLNVVVEYQKNVPALYKEIKDVVVSQVTKMTDLEVVEVNVNVVDIKTKEQHEADSVSLQDRVTDVASSTGEFASEQFEKVKSGIGSGVAAVQEKVGEGVEAVKGETNEKARVH